MADYQDELCLKTQPEIAEQWKKNRLPLIPFDLNYGPQRGCQSQYVLLVNR